MASVVTFNSQSLYTPVDNTILHHTWSLQDGSKVHLIQSGDKLAYEVVNNSGEIIRGSIPTPSNCRMNDCVNLLLNLRPYVYGNSIEFLVEGTAKSVLDSNVTLNESEWGITLVDLGQSQRDDETTWGGHAVIIIETVEYGQYHMKRADIIRGNIIVANYNAAEVRIFETSFDKLCLKKGGLLPKTQTWLRTKSIVQKMINQIELEKASYEEKKPIVLFSIDRKVDSMNSDASFIARNYSLHNCISWDRAKLHLADIQLPFNGGIILETDLPINYIGTPLKAVALDMAAYVKMASFFSVMYLILRHSLSYFKSHSEVEVPDKMPVPKAFVTLSPLVLVYSVTFRLHRFLDYYFPKTPPKIKSAAYVYGMLSPLLNIPLFIMSIEFLDYLKNKAKRK